MPVDTLKIKTKQPKTHVCVCSKQLHIFSYDHSKKENN